MTAQINAQDEDDWMGIADLADIGVVVLVVDASGTRDLVVDGTAEARGQWLTERAFEDCRAAYRRCVAGTTRSMIVKLLGSLDTGAVGELLP